MISERRCGVIEMLYSKLLSGFLVVVLIFVSFSVSRARAAFLPRPSGVRARLELGWQGVSFIQKKNGRPESFKPSGLVPRLIRKSRGPANAGANMPLLGKVFHEWLRINSRVERNCFRPLSG